MKINYQIDISRFTEWLLPVRLRIAFWVAWFNAMVSQIQVVYNNFIRYKDKVNYDLSITPQVCRLEKALNDAFDLIERRITITDSLEYLVTLIHLDDANLPLITNKDNSGLYVPIIHLASAHVGGGTDFNVNIPFSLSASETYRLKSILDTYKLASKRYAIIYTL